MSLLLDALQRASKDKEKAAAQDAAGLVLPASHSAPPPMELALAEQPAAPDSFPQLEPAHHVPLAATAPTPEPQHAPTWDIPQELTLDLPAQTPSPTPVVAATEQVATQPPVHSAPSPAAASPAPAKAPAPSLPQQPAPELAPSAPAVAAARPGVSSPAPSRVAQDMRRAYMPAGAPGAKRRRTLVYAGLSVAAIVVLAGLGFKMWEDTASLRGASSLLPPSATPNTPTQSPPPAAIVPPSAADATPPSAEAPPANLSGPVPADIELLPRAKPPAAQTPLAAPKVAPVIAPAPTSASISAPTSAATAAATPTPTSTPLPASNQVQVQGAGAKQSFESKMRGPSPLELGYAALLAGRWDEAALHYTQALKANSEERDALLGLAYVAQQKGLRDDAQLLYRRVLRQEPGNAIASSALLALDFEADGTQSASRAKELAMRQPDSAATMSMAGTVAVREGLLADAAQLFARAQYLEPANPMHAYNHAVALDRLGQHAAAALQYEQVLKLSEKPATGRSAFSVDAVRERLTQLRQALASPSKPTK